MVRRVWNRWRLRRWQWSVHYALVELTRPGCDNHDRLRWHATAVYGGYWVNHYTDLVRRD